MSDVVQVYDNERYRVVEYRGADEDLIVLFSSLRKDQRLTAPAFGEAYLQKRRKSYLSVRAERNDWFQGPVEPAIEAVRQRVAGRQAIGYGSSMGAYASINFSAVIGLQRSVCFAPQYSVDQTKAPFERRWRREASELDFHCDQIDKVPEHRCTIVYDPRFMMDASHVSLIAGKHNVQKIELPGSGHNVGSFLKNAGVIGEFTRVILEDDLESINSIIAKLKAGFD